MQDGRVLFVKLRLFALESLAVPDLMICCLLWFTVATSTLDNLDWLLLFVRVGGVRRHDLDDAIFLAASSSVHLEHVLGAGCRTEQRGRS